MRIKDARLSLPILQPQPSTYQPDPKPNNRRILSHKTFAISVNPEIGLVAGEGTVGRAVTEDGMGGGERMAADAASRAAPGALLCARCVFRLVANCAMSCAAVAWIMPTPRPYWATAPDSDRSVWTSTFDPPDAGSSRNDATALAPPRPFKSVPCAFTRAR